MELLDYNPSTGLFTWKIHRSGQHPPGTVAGSRRYADGYIRIRVDGTAYVAHRLAWLYMTGDWPDKDIDHKNLMKDDNRWVNLRQATHRQNMINVAARNKSGNPKEAFFCKRDRIWVSCIKINGKQIRLGTFTSAEAAHQAYCEAANKYFGEFARAA